LVDNWRHYAIGLATVRTNARLLPQHQGAVAFTTQCHTSTFDGAIDLNIRLRVVTLGSSHSRRYAVQNSDGFCR
jgi:hypothetical protein